MLLRNWIYNTNVVIFAGTASSEPYICYYCQSVVAHTTSILDHIICYHPNEKFTYRYLLLDETDGIMKYRSRHFNIPCSSLRREKNNGSNISTSRVIGIVCASYLDSHWYATVNTAIIYSYHGLLSVRYVALYDRIERQWHVFVQKCKRFIEENISKHFPWKMLGRCPSTSFFKNNVPCATEGRST